MKICLLDPGIENHNNLPSYNLGDLIIQSAVLREITSIFGKQNIVKISTHAPLTQEHLKLIHKASLVIVGGTNLLSSNMDKYNQWKISVFDAFRISKAVLLGVGWWQYQKTPNLYTTILIKSALSSKAIHSVRDDYTRAKLNSIGVKNVLNTGCPTMWPLANVNSEEIPFSKSENALVMLTDYSKNIDLDRKLLELVISKYAKVFVWPQGKGDLEYVLGMNLPVTMLAHSLLALEQFIDSKIEFDYIGTRLHGGVRCLLAKKRTLVLEIDNRAREIARETKLPTSARSDFEYINQWIDGQYITKIELNLSSINQWKNQFRNKSEVVIQNCEIRYNY